MHSADLPRVTLPGARLRQTLDVVAIALLVASSGLAWMQSSLTATPATNQPLWLIVDVSRSMLAGTPSRMDLARTGISIWLGKHGNRLPRPTGLIVFAAHAHVVVSPTTNSRLIGSQIARLNLLAELPELAPRQGDRSGTNLAAGLMLAQEWSQGATTTTWLFSDGDDPAFQSASATTPLASRAWLVGSTEDSHVIPNTDPPIKSKSMPELVNSYTVMANTTLAGERPPQLPMLDAPVTVAAHQALPSWLALLAVFSLLLAAIPRRLAPVLLLGIAGCGGKTDAETAREGQLMISQARQLPASERGALLRAAEEKLRASMRAPGTATTDRLRDLVICLLEQAQSEPPDLKAASLAAEIAIRLPPELGPPLRARARWLASQSSHRQNQEQGSDGPSTSEGNGDQPGDAIDPSSLSPSRQAASAADATNELPGAGRLPVVADSAIPQNLTPDEAMRLLAAASRRLTPPSLPKRPKPPTGVPDW